MAITIQNIPFSFFQFGDTAGLVPLPVKSASDLKFQIAFLSDDDTEAGDLLDSGDIEIFVVKNVPSIESDPDINSNKIGSGVAVEADIVWRIDDLRIGAYWSNLFNDFEAIGEDTCFRFAIRITSGGSKFYFLSNTFIRTSDDYTSTIEYSCAEDNYGFYYCDRYVPNKVRLGFFLSRAQYKTDRALYFKSDGSARITKSVTRKELDGLTDHFPEDLHEKFTIALGHDRIYIESEQYKGEVARSGDYEIDWTEHNDYRFAPAAFKVNALPFDATLNNCLDCKDTDENMCDAAIQIVNSDVSGGSIIVSWELISGNPSKYEVIVNDGKPIEVDVMSVQVDDLTPGDYEFKITPYCTLRDADISGETVTVIINIPDAEQECLPVGFEEFSLPDARVGEYYTYMVPITGTGPISVLNAQRPAWLHINTLVNHLLFHGTPFDGSEGNDIVVAFLLGNCYRTGYEPNTVQVTKSINVIGINGVPVSGVRVYQYEEQEICSRPVVTVYLDSGNYFFEPGRKVYEDSGMTIKITLKYILDTDGNLWRTNLFGELALIQTNYC